MQKKHPFQTSYFKALTYNVYKAFEWNDEGKQPTSHKKSPVSKDGAFHLQNIF